MLQIYLYNSKLMIFELRHYCFEQAISVNYYAYIYDLHVITYMFILRNINNIDYFYLHICLQNKYCQIYYSA